METMTAYILAAALGLAIAGCLYLYSELSFERAVSASKTRTINDTSKTADELYKKVMRMQKTLDSDARLIETLDDERQKLKQQRDKYKSMFEQTVEGLEIARHQRDKAGYELSKLKANTVNKITYTINVDSDKIVKEVVKRIKEKYGENLK